jgi:hypothetical protein
VIFTAERTHNTMPDTPIVLISPEARAALEAEVDRGGASGDLSGGLLFGRPLNGQQRLVVSSVRLNTDVGFGDRSFSLDQTRTSRQLDHARGLDPQASYNGVWYLHRTPNRELSAEEWVQTQSLLEDPDFRFDDLVCLVLCFYYAELNIYASSFNRHHSARGQAPAPTELRLTTDWHERPTGAPPPRPAASSPSTEWYKAPQAAARLDQERQRLAKKYHVDPALAPNGQMYFRLSPKLKHEKMAFYLASGPGFPDRAPHVFLLVGGKPQRIVSPGLVNWSPDKWLAQLADELVEWLAFSLDEYLVKGEEALERGDHQQATDLLTLVLAIEPQTPGAARLLARAQALA